MININLHLDPRNNTLLHELNQNKESVIRDYTSHMSEHHPGVLIANLNKARNAV